jgi:hypothetical protein
MSDVISNEMRAAAALTLGVEAEQRIYDSVMALYCEACGGVSNDVEPVAVSYPDGTPSVVRACADCRANPPECSNPPTAAAPEAAS